MSPPPVRRIRPSEYRSQRWKNGAGTTTEIFREPLLTTVGASEVGGDDAFLFRVSIAEVAADGPFSRFDGYDRHIMVMEGKGMHLDCGSHGALDLEPLKPRVFYGGWDVTGTLVDGPVRDFNLMVNREHARGVLEVVGEPGVLQAHYCLVYVLSGPGAGETLVGPEIEIPPGVTAAIVRLFRS